MNPQMVSILTSVGMMLASSVVAWAVSRGFVAAADQSTLTNDLVGLVGGAIAIALTWFKANVVSPKSMIATINDADNGVKVVAETAPAEQVSAPLK